MKKNIFQGVFILITFFLLTLIYLFPLMQGLILLPLDMLVSNYSPGEILVKNPYMQDSIVQLFPWKHLVFQSFQNHMIPFWNPYQLMGMPFMAGMKPMVFYPLNIFYIFGEINAWHLLLFSQIFLSLLFTYLLARSFKLGIWISIFASLVFSLNTLMMGVLEFGSDGHALLWFPLLILCAKKYLEEQKGKYLSILGCAIGISIFAGQLQYTGYTLILLASFIFYYGYSLKTRISTYIFLALSVIFGFGLSAVQLLPGLELFSHSMRGITDSYNVFVGGLDQPVQILRLFAPDFFGNPVTRDATIGYIESIGYFGIIPLFFSVYAIFFVRKNIFVTFFTIVTLISLLLAMQGIGQVVYFLHIPLISSGEGDRIFSVVYLSCAILSGFGLTEFLLTKNRKRNLISISLFFLLFAIILLGRIVFDRISAKAFLHNVQFTILIFAIFFIGTLLFSFLKKKIKLTGALFLLFVVGLTYADLFRVGYHFLTFSNKKFLYPQMKVTKYIKDQSKNTLARNIGLTEPELATYVGVYTIETYNPLYLQRNGELLQALQKKNPKDLPKKNKYFISNGISKDENLKFALDFLGVSQIVVNKDANPSNVFFNSPKFQNDFVSLYKDERYAVYNNITAYPRFGLYYKDVISKNDAKTLMLLANRKIDFRNTIILDQDLPMTLQKGTGTAKLVNSNLNSQTFQITSTQEGLFYISDTYFPGWKAIVDGQPLKIYRANYNFRAVIIPKGSSRLTFTYVPTNFFLGIFVSCISVILLSCFLFLPKRFYNLFSSPLVQ
ncbi:MAG TPA: YfhO family protein [Candidatus Saccharimonadales bacterium]|nr:YfhO family protein [Candidatus Saccharimonadales bacterium]